MQKKLFDSRRSPQFDSPVKLKNLSPQKYGGAAYVDLTYTPSKLADNYLYKEVTTMKKVEEGNGKVREIEALNSIFMDRLDQIKEERDGIEQSLTSQIVMYKKLLQESQIKNQNRIRQIQVSFKTEIQQILDEKQEAAKFAQSQKEIYQARIEELEEELNNLKNKLSNHGDEYDNLKNQKEKLQIKHQNLQKNLAQLQAQMQKEGEEAKQRYDDLNRKFRNSELEWRKNLEDAVNKKEKQIQNLERLHRTEQEKQENKRAAENLMKNQEIKDLTYAFEEEAKRLNEIINMKEKMIDGLNKDLNREKQKILDLTRSYEKEINDLVHQKNRLFDEVDSLNHDNTTLSIKLNDMEALLEREKIDFTNCVSSLKDQVEMNQVNYLRQKDRNVYLTNDLEKQISCLRSQNTHLLTTASENEVLTREIRNLRELLLESSNQMEKCKEQFVRMGREKDMLVMRLREVGGENQLLHKIKHEREEEARGWRNSYYNTRNCY